MAHHRLAETFGDGERVSLARVAPEAQVTIMAQLDNVLLKSGIHTDNLLNTLLLF